ncbi:MAG: response regulator [bacterium]
MTQSQTTILIVDDSPVFLETVRNMLESKGFETRCALNAVEALELLNSETPDIIILDYMMPDVDGYELALRIRKTSSKNRNTPIIVVTSTTDTAEAEKFIALSVQGYLLKPFADDSLLLIIDKIMTDACGKEPLFPLLSMTENELVARFSDNRTLIEKKLRKLVLLTGLEMESGDPSAAVKNLREKKMLSNGFLSDFGKLSDFMGTLISINTTKRDALTECVILQTRMLEELDKRTEEIMKRSEKG